MSESTAPQSTASSERDLLLRFREGDREAFAELVAAYRAPVWSYLVRCNIPAADREDLFQDIFIRVHRAAGQYEPSRPLHPWLFTIVANVVRTFHRKRKLRGILFADAADVERADRAPSGERSASARQTVDWLEHEIRDLPPAQREVLLLAGVQNVPQKDVAGALGLPLNTVKTHLRRARLTLAEKLRRRNRAQGVKP
ncbi:MAG: RNA polymerase sigma factor [bacterium]|nr:RNA polymerase sigma factor [bacterium]